MAINVDDIVRRLGRQRDAGSYDDGSLPAWTREARLAKNRLPGPLTFVPYGSLVSIAIDVPGNSGGKFEGLVWTCGERHGLDVEDSRQEITDLTRIFLNHVLPLPR